MKNQGKPRNTKENQEQLHDYSRPSVTRTEQLVCKARPIFRAEPSTPYPSLAPGSYQAKPYDLVAPMRPCRVLIEAPTQGGAL